MWSWPLHIHGYPNGILLRTQVIWGFPSQITTYITTYTLGILGSGSDHWWLGYRSFLIFCYCFGYLQISIQDTSIKWLRYRIPSYITLVVCLSSDTLPDNQITRDLGIRISVRISLVFWLLPDTLPGDTICRIWVFPVTVWLINSLHARPW